MGEGGYRKRALGSSLLLFLFLLLLFLRPLRRFAYRIQGRGPHSEKEWIQGRGPHSEKEFPVAYPLNVTYYIKRKPYMSLRYCLP